MKTFLCLAFVGCTLLTSAQTFSIIYSNNPTRQPREIGFTMNGAPVYNTHILFRRLVFNDTAAIGYFLHNYKPRTELRDTIKLQKNNRVTYYFRNTHKWYNLITSKRDQKGIVRSPEKPAWVHTGRQFRILNLDCKEAYYINMNRDTIFAAYAEDLPYPYDPFCYGGLPGVILEITDPLNRMVWTAEKISRSNAEIKLPPNLIIVDKIWDPHYGR